MSKRRIVSNAAPTPFLPQTLTATLSDNTAAMFVAKYTTGPLKLFAGYEHIRHTAPSDPQAAFTDIAGDYLCLNCQAFNNTNINNTAYGVNGLGNKTLNPEFLFSTPPGGPAFCSDSSHSQCAGTYDPISAAVDWRFAPKWGSLFWYDVQPGAWRVGVRLLPAQQHRSQSWSALPVLEIWQRLRDSSFLDR